MSILVENRQLKPKLLFVPRPSHLPLLLALQPFLLGSAAHELAGHQAKVTQATPAFLNLGVHMEARF